eukprot:Tamp_33139.p3 GENE.Tamp_33139~~Tamp_33139.p3  ORF type:complete len:133 (-),score=6.99 Tamp_33139:73-471(-)
MRSELGMRLRSPAGLHGRHFEPGDPGAQMRPRARLCACACVCTHAKFVLATVNSHRVHTRAWLDSGRVLPVREMAPWIKPAATKSVAALGKITLGVVALTCAYAGMERAMDDASAKPIEGTHKLKARKSGTW